jgi:3-oxoacyl-[acyl-carrier-protein] synthase-3
VTARTVILGSGGYLPERVLTNDDLSRMVDTSDEWIVQRTGIKRRHIAAPGQLTSDLATEAARRALKAAGVGADEIDLIVVATTTPDQTFPATAVTVQAKLGITQGQAFDLQAVCSGFVYALTTADALVKAGTARRALVIGAETLSRILDWTDRTTCVLFGRYQDKLYVDGGPSSTGTVGHLRMEGKEVFRYAVGMISDVIEETLGAAGMTAADIDWFVPHQANIRIIDGSAKKLGIASEKVVRTVADHGNTSAASIPLALSVAVGDGRIKKGDIVMLEAMGGGFTWGAVLVRW